MKFSTVFIAAVTASSAQAFAPSRPNTVKSLSAATLEAPPAEEKAPIAADVPSTAPSDMGVIEKDWPVDIVKDSDRVMP